MSVTLIGFEASECLPCVNLRYVSNIQSYRDFCSEEIAIYAILNFLSLFVLNISYSYKKKSIHSSRIFVRIINVINQTKTRKKLYFNESF